MIGNKPKETGICTSFVAVDEVRLTSSLHEFFPEGRLASFQLLSLLNSKCSSRDVQLLFWKHLDGYTNKEIAQRLSEKPSTIGTWLDRARRSLKNDDSFREALYELAVAS